MIRWRLESMADEFDMSEKGTSGALNLRFGDEGVL